MTHFSLGRLFVMVFATGLCEPALILAGTIEGTVVDGWTKAVGKPEGIKGVKVQAKLQGGKLIDADGMTTNDRGEYRVLDLPAGDVEIRCSRVGYLDFPTLKPGIPVKADAATKLEVELYRQNPPNEYFTAVADVAARNASEGNKTSYQRLWLSLYRLNVPIDQKPAFARALIAKDSRVTESVPQIAQYVELDPERLKTVYSIVSDAFLKQDFKVAFESKPLKALPPAVYADVVTQVAVVSTGTDDAKLDFVKQFSEASDGVRRDASFELINLRIGRSPPQKFPFDKFATPP